MTEEVINKPSATAKNVERRIEIRRRYAEFKSQLEAILSTCHQARVSFNEIDGRCQSMERDFQDKLRLRETLRKPRELLELETELEEARNRSANAERKKEEINAELARLSTELAASYGEASIEDILAHQANIENAEAEIERLSGLIAIQKEIIETAKSVAEPLELMQSGREDLLAEIAEGKGDQTRLDELNEAILELECRATEAQRQADQAKMTIRGLRRKLDREKNLLDELKARTGDFINDLLLSEANRLYQDYEVVAREFSDLFARLVALDQMSANKSSFLGLRWDEVNIPAFRLKSAVEKPQSGIGEVLFAANDLFKRKVVQEAKDSELERFRNLGVAV